MCPSLDGVAGFGTSHLSLREIAGTVPEVHKVPKKKVGLKNSTRSFLSRNLDPATQDDAQASLHLHKPSSRPSVCFCTSV